MEIRKIAIFGAGVMGAGIAQDAAAHGLEVVLVDRMEEGLAHARQSIEDSLNHELQRWGITGSEKKVLLSHIKFTLDRQEAGSVDFVVEAIPDDLAAKQELFEQLESQFEKTCPGKVTYVSNTAVLPITDIALKMTNKDRLVGMHFLAPVPAIKLVEMVRGSVHVSGHCRSCQGTCSAHGEDPCRRHGKPGLYHGTSRRASHQRSRHVVSGGHCQQGRHRHRDASWVWLQQGPVCPCGPDWTGHRPGGGHRISSMNSGKPAIARCRWCRIWSVRVTWA